MKPTFKKIKSKIYQDPDTLVEIYPYEDKGKICPYVLHSSPIGKQFSGYVLILKDLDFAINCLENLRQNKVTDSQIRTAILFAGLFTYMKCFTSGSERGTHLHKDIFKRQSKKNKKLHKKIDEFRNKYLAHASTQTYETSNIALFLNPDQAKKEILTMSIAAKYIKSKDDELIDYIELMNKVKELVAKKMKKKLVALKKEVRSIPIEELYSRAKEPDKLKFRNIELGKYKAKEDKM